LTSLPSTLGALLGPVRDPTLNVSFVFDSSSFPTEERAIGTERDCLHGRLRGLDVLLLAVVVVVVVATLEFALRDEQMERGF
jgi:hypothetical protein